jgi:hypothetical protein
MLRPEFERVDGFVDDIRYRSLNREGLKFEAPSESIVSHVHRRCGIAQ